MVKALDHRIRVAAIRREEMNLHLLFSGLVLASKTSIYELEVEDVVRHAQVSRGSFYNYFPTLSALYDSLLTQVMKEISDRIDGLEPQSPDVAIRLASTTRKLMRLVVDFPVLGQFLKQTQWPSRGPDLNVFNNIITDVESGIKEGRFTSMPDSIGVNIVVGSIIGGIHAMLLESPATGYEDKVANQFLLGLGVDRISASQISQLPLPPRSIFPATGILGKLLELGISENS
jgi:AcrR family transcriptional regulator